MFFNSKYQPYKSSNKQRRVERLNTTYHPKTEAERRLEKIRNRNHNRFIEVHSAGHREELLGTWDEDNNTCYYFRPGMMVFVQFHEECSCAMCFKVTEETFKRQDKENDQYRPKNNNEDYYWQPSPPPTNTQDLSGNNEWGYFNKEAWEQPNQPTRMEGLEINMPSKSSEPVTKEEYIEVCIDTLKEIHRMNPIWEDIVHHIPEIHNLQNIATKKQAWKRHKTLIRAKNLLIDVFHGKVKASTANWEWTLYMGVCQHQYPHYGASTACPSCSLHQVRLDERMRNL
jgi:hypothetical protein